MKHHEHLPMQQNNDEQLPEIAIDEHQQGPDTLDGCTMDPCPMKEKNKSKHVGKCPDCGKVEKVKSAYR
ncbi:MAG: hypothetical protein V4456_01395 [Bacteroidota bacterium]